VLAQMSTYSHSSDKTQAMEELASLDVTSASLRRPFAARVGIEAQCDVARARCGA
jgi:hypothetical protein